MVIMMTIEEEENVDFMQIIVMAGRAAVFAVPVCCESGSMYFSVEHLLGGPVIRQTTE
jgi:hypothetical protein